MIKKTYIPSKPRNPKLGVASGTSGAVGKTEFNQVAGSSHEHPNKGVLDRITEAMLVGALRDLITSTDTESELTDENILSSLRVLSEITKNNETFLEDLKERFLSKIEPDTAQKLITFVEGIEVGEFTTGALGGGAAVKMIDGTSFAEVDNLTVRQKATFRELIIESLKHIGGQLVLTPARMKCVRVVDGGTYYKCYFDTGDGEVSNEFVAGDLARCQVFTGSGTKFYWRLVTLIGDDWINLSKTSAAEGSDAPEAGDDITQLGNATDTERQSAIILSTVGIDAPSWKQYSGINAFSLEGKETTVFSKLGNRISGETVFTSGGANLEDHLDGVAQDILDALRAAQDAEDKAQQAIEDAEADVATINEEIGRLQDQIDGKVSNWYYAYSPTLENYPASDWTTNEIRDAHVGDTFTNTQTFVDDETTPDAGKSWRFVKDGSTYSWAVMSDSDAIKALLEASKAQATADGKSTTYLFQPTKYKLGDMWVLNDDQTVNGTAYKQGDLLTATQDSETFNGAHWLKRIRYTDDTAINELEIGGRNLIRNSDFSQESNINRWALYDTARSAQPINFGGKHLSVIEIANYEIGDKARIVTEWNITLVKGTTYTISYYGVASGGFNEAFDEGFYKTPNSGFIKIPTPTKTLVGEDIYNGSTRSIYKYSSQFTFDEATSDRAYFILGGITDSGTLEPHWFMIGEIKLEKGNKATDWSPAPEDVEANIETAKTEAESAAKDYADIQAEAERIKAEAYADGIVSDEEQARIDDVNAKLALAKEYAEAQDALLKTQQEAYADGKISTAEQAAIDAAKDYADLKKTEAEAYADGIVSDEEARAIADALDKYNASKAHAEQLVKDIEIGGRNLLRRYGEQRNKMVGIDGSISDYSGAALSIFPIKVSAGEKLVFTKTTSTNADNAFRYKYININGDFIIRKAPSANVSFDIVPDNATEIIVSYPYDSVVKIEKGNKATDWTPAPEDVEASIETAKADAESAANAYAEAQAEAERVKAEAYADDIVTAEEQARIDDVNDKLALAKEHAEAQDALLKTQQEAYADGEISKAEQAAIEAARDYADLKKTEAEAYADGIVSDEEARAIADALEKYNESKAYAEQLVDDIEIGGRNLFVLTGSQDEIVPNEDWLNMVERVITLIPDTSYTLSTNLSEDTNMFFLIPDDIPRSGSNGVNINGSRTIKSDAEGKVKIVFRTIHYLNRVLDGEKWVKLEKGNKATDWTPAPEDVEADIATAKTDAENAAKEYALQKAEAERVKAEAYADGIVSDEEQARIDDVNNKLVAAKEYAEAQDALLKTQQEAYADGEITKAEQAAIQAAEDYADAMKTQAEAYADGIVSDEEARAIADALEKYNESKAYAEQIVEDIEIGGRNLIRYSDFSQVSNIDKWSLVDSARSAQPINFGGRHLALLTISNYELGDKARIRTESNIPLVKGTSYTISYYGVASGWFTDAFDDGFYKTPDSGYIKIPTPSKTLVGEDIYTGGARSIYKYTSQFTFDEATSDSAFFLLGGHTDSGSLSPHWFMIGEIKLEKGNKATDWTPAPEDVQAEIDDAKQEAEDAAAKAQALDYLKQAIGQDGKIQGALYTLVTILLKANMNADVTAGISGIQGAAKNLPAFWAGGTDVQAQQGTAKAIIRHDGTSKFTDAEITGIINALSGDIGNFTIQDGELKSSYSVSRAIWDYSKFPAVYVGERYVGGEVTISADAVELSEDFSFQGIPSTTFTRITPEGVTVKSTQGLSWVTEAKLVDGRLSIENTNAQQGYSEKVEIFSDGIYFNGQKFTGGGGGYTHPSTHTASMITAGTLQGIVKANNNTSYTTKQVRNMILSTGNAISSQMANGDIWIKYE